MPGMVHMLWLLLLDLAAASAPAESCSLLALKPKVLGHGACTPVPPADAAQRSFAELLKESGSDKFDPHHYEYMYERWLAPYRHAKDLKMIEIGAKHGQSLNLWSSYFTNPKLIVGLAYGSSGDVSNLSENDKVSVHHGDQSKPETMQELMHLGPWDLVVDDGSHVPEHMIFSFFALWKNLKPGGLYVIEDLETNYWKRNSAVYEYPLEHTGIGVDASNSAVTKLEQLSRVLLRYGLGAEGMSIMPGDASLCSMEWGQNLVAMRKCTDAERKARPAAPEAKTVEGLQRWLEEAKASNPEEVALPPSAPSSPEPSCVSKLEDSSFAAALRKLGSPQWSRRLYEIDYARWLADFRALPNVKVAELGSQAGLSARLWESYFRSAEILCASTSRRHLASSDKWVAREHQVDRAGNADAAFSQLNSRKAAVYRGDSSKDTLEHVRSQGPWDVIVDDGSRQSSRIASLFALWPSVRPGGLYIFEDALGDAWPSLSRQGAARSATVTGNTTAAEVTFVSKLEQIKQVLMRYEIGSPQMSVMPGDDVLCSVEWGMNIVALRKCSDTMSRKRFKAQAYDGKEMAEWLSHATSTNPGDILSSA